MWKLLQSNVINERNGQTLGVTANKAPPCIHDVTKQCSMLSNAPKKIFFLYLTSIYILIDMFRNQCAAIRSTQQNRIGFREWGTLVAVVIEVDSKMPQCCWSTCWPKQAPNQASFEHRTQFVTYSHSTLIHFESSNFKSEIIIMADLEWIKH